MDSLPQDCQELIAQLAAQSTSGGVSVLTLMALAGVSRSWRTVVAQIDVRDAELQFCTSDDATVGQRKGRSTSAEAGLESAYKAASETGKARLLESAVRLLRHYRCASLGAATDAVLSQVPSTPRASIQVVHTVRISMRLVSSPPSRRPICQTTLRNRPGPGQPALQLVGRACEGVRSGAVAVLAPVVDQSFTAPLSVGDRHHVLGMTQQRPFDGQTRHGTMRQHRGAGCCAATRSLCRNTILQQIFSGAKRQLGQGPARLRLPAVD